MGTFQAGGSVTISNLNIVTQSPATYSFFIVNQNPIPTSSYITIALPTGISILTSSFSVTCVLYCDQTTITYTYSSITNIITLTSLFSSSYIASGTPIKFDIVGFVNPPTVANYAFTITSWETTSATPYAIDTINTLYITPSPGVITITSILPTDSTRIYDLPTSYTFKLTSSITISPSNILVIVFPADFQVQSNTTCTMTGFHTVYTCIPNSSTNTITMQTFLSGTLSANVQVPTFTVTCIKNPGTFQTTGSIVVTQYTSTYGEMATGSITIKANYFTYNYIETFSVATSNYNAGQYPTNYTFTVMPRAKVTQGAYLSVSLASDIQMPSSSQVSKYCGGTSMSGFNANSAGLYCSVSSSTYIIQVSSGFSAGASSADPPKLVFTLLYLKNPRSTQTTNPFNVTIYDSSNKLLYAWNYTTTPTVSMTGASTPNYISFQRDSTQNGVFATYYWIIQNNNYYQNGDSMIIKAPSPVQFSLFSTCIGINNLKSSLTCSVSSDLYTMNVTIASNMRRELSTGKIPGSSSLSLNITNILNAPSYRPTTNSFTYNVYSSGGYQIESQTTSLNVTNALPGILSYQTTGVSPANYNYNAIVAYTLIFVPKNYEMGMYIYVTVPSQLTFPSSQIICTAVTGAETSLTCISDSSSRKIKITNAFSTTRTAPYLIKIALSSFTNPSNKLITDSFLIETYTTDAYKMDQLTTGLTINFICTYPCKSCDINNNSYCYSCYTTDTQRYFYKSSCLSTCPATTYADQGNVSCNNCTSPCATCVNSSTTCLTCIKGYTLNGTTCYTPTLAVVSISKDNIISFFYPWPFVACSFLMTILVLICILCKKETKFRESIIALVAWPEFLSWIALATYQYYEYQLSLFFVLIAGGIFVQIILNVTYGLVHQKRIIPLANESYRNFLIDYHKCSVVSLMISFIFTFKFHHIMLSFLGNGEHLKGEFNKPAWKVWNSIAIVSILFSYIPIAGSCVLYLLQTQQSGSVLYFLNIEVLAISTYVAILLLMGIFRTCCCTCNSLNERKKRKEGSREEKYNEVKNDSISMIQEESTKKSKKSKLDDMIDEEDIEVSSSTIKRKNKRRHDFIYTQNIEEDEVDYDAQNKSKRHRETEPLTAENKKYEKKYKEEMEKLIKMTEMLKSQQELHNFEKRLILQERERVLRDKDEQFKEIEDLKSQLKDEKEEIKKERAQLVDQRDEFLEQVDRRVKQRIEDWEMQSMRSITTIAKRLKLAEDMDNQDQSIQTIKRMNEVNFNVDVGAENTEQMKQRLLNQPDTVTKEEIISKKYEQKTMGKIVEEEYDSDDLNQILKKADEVLQQQQESNGEIQSAIQNLLPIYEKETSDQKQIESDPYLAISSIPKPIYEKSEKDERIIEQESELFINILPQASYSKDSIIREDILEGDDVIYFINEKAKFAKVDDDELNQKNIDHEELYFTMPKASYEHVDNQSRELGSTQQNFFVQDKPMYEHIGDNERELDASQQNFFTNDKAKFEHNDEDSREVQMSEEVIEPLDNKPYFNKTNNNFIKGEKEQEEVSIQLPDSYQAKGTLNKEQVIQNQEDYVETTMKPEYKQIEYQNEDDIEMKTEYNDDLDEIKMNEDKQEEEEGVKNVNIEAEDLDKDRDFAKKKKKKVLYSDKSESSVDEMMEDTPSNYNIPNGRLDGKSMGIKSVLLFNKKQGLKQPGATPILETQKNPLDINQKINQNNAKLLNQNRLANPPKHLQQDEERKFVNNLFKDNGNQGQIGIGGSKTIAKNLSVPRQNDRNHIAFDSGNEASWRAFNQPVGKGALVVAGNDTTQTINDGHQLTNDYNDEEMMGVKRKKKKVINAQKQFKEPPPNVERIKALESAYMGGRQNNNEPMTGRQNQDFSLGRTGKNQPLINKATLPHRMGGGFGLDTTPHETEEKKANRLMKNNFL